MAAPAADWLTIEPSQLLHCFKHPARYLLEQRLGLHLAQGTEVLAGDEPFSVEWTSQHGLRQLALQAIEQNWTEPQERAVAAASGWLPVGELGQAYWGQIRGPIRAFAPTLFDERPAEAAQPLLVDITLAGVRIHGWLEGVTDEGLFDYRLRDLGAWELAPFWLRHLLLNCAATPGIARDSRLLSPNSEWRLGPLTNPAKAPNIVMGVFHSELVGIQAKVLQLMGAEHALVVHGKDGLDEITLSGPTIVAELLNGQIKEYEISPGDFGMATTSSLESLKVKDANESKAIILQVLDNQSGLAKDIVCLNAGATLYAANIANSIADGIYQAKEAIASGKAKQKLGWVSEISAQQMCSDMVASDLAQAKQHALLKKHGYDVNVSVE